MTETTSDEYLYETSKLMTLSNWPAIEKTLADKGLIARPLKLSDYYNGYIELLNQLTEVGQVTRAEFERRFHEMKEINASRDHYIIVIIEDTTTKRVVGCSTLFLELKIIHQCGQRARLEEVAVLEAYRGQGIGELVVKIIVELAHEVYKCYKLTLDCTDQLKVFYAKNGFTYGSNMMNIRF